MRCSSTFSFLAFHTSLLAQGLFRLAIAGIVSSILIYIPNYFLLQALTATLSARALTSLGYPSSIQYLGNAIFLNSFQVTRGCTGIEGIVPLAVFLIVIPGIGRARKFIAVVSAGSVMYLANIFRIVLELAMYSNGVVSWSVVHDDFGFVFSVASVVMILFLATRIIAPEGAQDFVKTLLRTVRAKRI